VLTGSADFATVLIPNGRLPGQLDIKSAANNIKRDPCLSAPFAGDGVAGLLLHGATRLNKQILNIMANI
jgi:hypothetical protein